MTDQEILDQAHERFQIAADAESEMRAAALDDFEFRKGSQWSNDVKRIRESQNLPVLTINRLPRTLSMVTNEQRQQKPSIQVNPQGSGADKETAEVLEGMVRHIEVNSNADVARDLSFDHMVTGGFGYRRVLTEYVDDNSFDQEIIIAPIENPFSVYRDPFSSLVDLKKTGWYIIIDDPSPEQYKADFPKSKLAALDLDSTGNAPPGWVTKDARRIAEYFYFEIEPRALYQLDDGSITSSKPDDKAKIVNEREVAVKQLKWVKLNGIEILQKRDWPGKYMPIIPVYGDALKVDGKLWIAGLVRDAKDPQRSYNYWVSRAAEACQIAPKAPYVIEAGQIEDFKAIWDKANTGNYAYLPYKGVSIGGSAVPPPQRQAVEPPIQAMAEMIRQSDNDFKVATGVYDASLGKQGPESSGKAVLARQKQTDISIMNYSDNMARSMLYEGAVILDLIPKVYTQDKIQRIINPDQSVDHVSITNSQGQSPEAPSIQ